MSATTRVTPCSAKVAIIAPRDEPGRINAVKQSKVASAEFLEIARRLVDDICPLWALLGGARRLHFGLKRGFKFLFMNSSGKSIMIKSRIMIKKVAKTAGRKDLREWQDL